MFVSALQVEACADPGKWKLLSQLIWQADGETIIVPAGFVTDLASVPWPMRGVLNTTGRSRRPAVLHDYLYATGQVTRAFADRLFLTALIADGVISVGRGLYYLGVRLGGWIPFRRYRKKEKGK